IGPLTGIVGKGVLVIGMAVAITVVIDHIGNTVPVRVDRNTARIVGIRAQFQLLFIGDAIAVAVRIAVVANAVTVEIGPLSGIVGKGILVVGATIAIAILIDHIGNTITIQIGWPIQRIIGV